MTASTRFTHKTKGGEYYLIGSAIGAGSSALHETVLVYQDVETGKLYYRNQKDFSNRMVEIKPSRFNKHGHENHCNLMHTSTMNTDQDFCDCAASKEGKKQ